MKIDDRIPSEIGKGALPEYAAIKTPWEKLVSFYDAYQYGLRHNAGISALYFEVIRILIPDEVERNKRMCDINYKIFYNIFGSGYGKIHAANHQVPPFVRGAMIAPLFGDSGDERLFMFGRVNDYGTYRVEKELDHCPYEIVGSECCRTSAYITEAQGDVFCKDGKGKKMDFNMYEARGCGDPHCRFIIESREKYPMPPRDYAGDTFAPIATEDQIMVTPLEKAYKNPQQFRSECDYQYRSGFNYQTDPTYQFKFGATTLILGGMYVIPMLDEMIANGEFTKEHIDNVIQCVFEGAGKMRFVDFFAVKGAREWLGVPADIKDGRVLGAYVEMLLRTWSADFEILAFNKDEVIYDISRLGGNEHKSPHTVHALISMWYGIGRTLVGPEWVCERVTDDVADDTIRIKIAKKIDKAAR
jgi:hypothetical protein